VDPRLSEYPILDRRLYEWNHSTIKNLIDSICSSVTLIDGWQYKGSEWAIHRNNNKKEEIKNNKMDIIKFIFQTKDGTEHKYSLLVPLLIHKNFFYINGQYKIPTFQLIDFPIIYRKDREIRFKNNLISIIYDTKTTTLRIFNKQIPIGLCCAALIPNDEINSFISDYSITNEKVINIIEQAKQLISTNTPQKINKIFGNYFISAYGDKVKKGEYYVFAINKTYDVDIFNKQFMKTNSIIKEILCALDEGIRDDTDLKNKRIRFSEYIVVPLIRKIYDMVLLNFGKKQNKQFKIQKSLIFDSCNVSEIVRFSYPANPIAETAALLQCTVVGPGAFKKDKVPKHIKDLHNSHFGFICPADTPDRDGCGVNLSLIPSVKINENGTFGIPSEDIITSYPITTVPGMEHNDQIRLQMASNHLKQAILLLKSEPPTLRSGTEDMFHEYTSFMKKADERGTVKYNDESIMVIAYKTGGVEILHLGFRNVFKGTVDFLISDLHEEDEFEVGDTIYYSKFLSGGIINTGNNLNTCLGIWEGYNYEDGIVISKHAASKYFESIHTTDVMFFVDPQQVLLSNRNQSNTYNPIPNIGDEVKIGDILAAIKNVDINSDIKNLFSEPKYIYAPISGKVIDVEMIPNNWNSTIAEYDNFIKDMIKADTDKYNKFEDILKATVKDEKQVLIIMKQSGLSVLNKESKKGTYSIKEQRFPGVFFKIKILYTEKINIGDKITNRHGNKGVIALIEDDENMPLLDDGRRADVILNPLGIPSRMNAGQLYEIHLNESLYQMQNKLRCSNYDDIESLVSTYYTLLDKTPDKRTSILLINEFNTNMISFGIDYAIDHMYIIQPPFQSVDQKDIEKIMDFSGANYKYRTFYPSQNMYIEKDITFGKMYFNKLIHRSSIKMNARSIGSYSKKTFQPSGGGINGKSGHRFGEMEVWALMAHGAFDVLKDLLTIQSDSPGLKNRLLAHIVQNPDVIDVTLDDDKTQILTLFEAYLSLIGLKLIQDEN
jgi:DNA-directed RNA polymerase beta subunit